MTDRYLIAEIGSANGDLSYALDCVDAFSEAGVFAIKGQLFRADTLTTRDALPYGKGITEPATQYEAFENALSYDEWGEVKARCDEKDVVFFGSVFDFDAVDAGVEQGWEAFKVASADITYRGLLEKVAATGVWTFLSTGASTLPEIVRATNLFKSRLTLMACTLSYPCDMVDANVGRMQTLRTLYQTAGYSDHTRSVAAADYAFRVGATYVEKHVTLTPGAGGDHDFAANPKDVECLLSGTVISDAASDALVAGKRLLTPIPAEKDARMQARRSPYTTRPITAGETLDETNTVMLRPAAGVDPFDLPVVAETDMATGTVVKLAAPE